MTETKKKRPTLTTPRGTFVFPKLAEPDTKFDPKGKYSVKVRFTAEEGAKIIAKLSADHAQAVADGEDAFKQLDVKARKKLKAVTVNPFFSPVYNKETEEETGEIEMSFGATASGVSKKTQKPWTRGPIMAFDASGKPFKAVSKIWSGTEGKVSFQYYPYFIPGTGACGLSLKLEAVQVLELSGPGSRSASQFGFDTEDGFDGSEFSDDDAPATPAAGSADEAEAGSDF